MLKRLARLVTSFSRWHHAPWIIALLFYCLLDFSICENLTTTHAKTLLPDSTEEELWSNPNVQYRWCILLMDLEVYSETTVIRDEEFRKRMEEKSVSLRVLVWVIHAVCFAISIFIYIFVNGLQKQRLIADQEQIDG